MAVPASLAPWIIKKRGIHSAMISAREQKNNRSSEQEMVRSASCGHGLELDVYHYFGGAEEDSNMDIMERGASGCI